MTIKGYIYLLKVGDTKNRIIYKVGKSINFYKRYKEYNYAEILTFIISNDIDNDELEIIKLFNINCKLDTGREFFTAQSDLFVLNLFLTYFKNKNEINLSMEQNNNNTNTNTNTNIEINENSETNKIIKCNKTCPTCKTIFKYPSRLKYHFQNTIHCKKTPDFIKNYFNTKEQKLNVFTKDTKSKNNMIKCDKCNKSYTLLHNLVKHKKKLKCYYYIQNLIL